MISRIVGSDPVPEQCGHVGCDREPSHWLAVLMGSEHLNIVFVCRAHVMAFEATAGPRRN